MKKPQANRYPFAKIVVLLAVGFFIGMGLCGLDSTLLERFRVPGNEFGPNTFVGSIGAFAILLSAAGLVITTIAWAVAASVRGFRYKGNASQKLFDEDDEAKRGNHE